MPSFFHNGTMSIESITKLLTADFEGRDEFFSDLLTRDVPDEFSASPEQAADCLAHIKRKECRACGAQLNRVRRCGRCRIAAYCNTRCQRQDYSKHKSLCELESALYSLLKDGAAGVDESDQLSPLTVINLIRTNQSQNKPTESNSK